MTRSCGGGGGALPSRAEPAPCLGVLELPACCGCAVQPDGSSVTECSGAESRTTGHTPASQKPLPALQKALTGAILSAVTSASCS